LDKYPDFYILYIEKEKDSFHDIVVNSYNIINQWLLPQEEDTFFSIFFDFKDALSIM